MQRIACHNFVSKMQGWTIVKEIEEKGVSGYKISASKRDAIQELKDAATRDEFDILLVFMFDRMGRIESETPFVLQWFISHGIECWSVNEGQQKIEQHVDKLMNYIRFWQASGESEKTSIRVKTRINQMVSEGIYTGGPIPFGYRLVNKGRVNKKGQEMRDLEIDPKESEVVKTMFSKVLDEGYGSHRLAELLNKQGVKTHNGTTFRSQYILRILRCELYRGFLVRGDTRSERIEDLIVIPDYMWFKVQEILDMRNVKNNEKRTVALTNRGRSLLGGTIYCGHCGFKMTTSRHVEKYTKVDGTTTVCDYPIYVCYHKSRTVVV